MLDLKKIGKQIAVLRKEKGYSGEKLAELLNITPQAVSKWENGKCLPETAILPMLAKTLDCSIDTLLLPRELFILEAVYTDGQISIPVTNFIDCRILDNTLSICVNSQFVGASIESDRLKLLTVKYQILDGTYFTYALQNEQLYIDKTTQHYRCDSAFQIIGAYYGNEKKYLPALNKMEHFKYFNWDSIPVNHETFPSNTASDDIEYLTLVYLNSNGIHTVSCAENNVIYYEKNHTELVLKDTSKCILPDIIQLSWDSEMACPWAGALYAALNYMGENYSYEEIMGMSGACYRVCFVDIWDWSCTDALVSFDYSSPLYRAVGYSQVEANRLEKGERRMERHAIMKDIQNNKPVLAINLRTAPEWGIITGYIDNGSEFLCRTYFDKEVFDSLEKEENSEEKRIIFEEHGGYLTNEFWPFLITHFGHKKEKPSPTAILMESLKILIDSFYAQPCSGYYQGKQAFQTWIQGLSEENHFEMEKDRENVMRRLFVNESMLLNLLDARHSAEKYLRQSTSLLPEEKQGSLIKLAENYHTICEMISSFQAKVRDYHKRKNSDDFIDGVNVSTPELRKEQICLLEKIILIEQENCETAKMILETGSIANY